MPRTQEKGGHAGSAAPFPASLSPPFCRRKKSPALPFRHAVRNKAELLRALYRYFCGISMEAPCSTAGEGSSGSAFSPGIPMSAPS